MRDATPAYSIWSVQLLLHISRNLVSTRTIDADTMRTLIEETQSQLTGVKPDDAAAFEELATVFKSGIDSAEDYLAKKAAAR